MLECNIPWFAGNKDVQFNYPGLVPSPRTNHGGNFAVYTMNFQRGGVERLSFACAVTGNTSTRDLNQDIRLCGLYRWECHCVIE